METNEHKKLSKEKDKLVEKLGYLQRKLKDLNVPVMVVLEGVHASGKGGLANDLLIAMDPRYTNFYATHRPTEEEARKPFLWQYFVHTPTSTQCTIYYRSWYSLYLSMKNGVVKNPKYKDLTLLLDEIRHFEETLVTGGAILLKFYISIEEEQQRQHIAQMADNPRTMWKAQEYDRENDENYRKDMETLIEKTEKKDVPWQIIQFEDRLKTSVAFLDRVVHLLSKRLKKEEDRAEMAPDKRDGFFSGEAGEHMERSDEGGALSKEEYRDRLEKLQREMRDIQYSLYEKKVPLILVYEGSDAAGKGGNIRRVIERLDPTGYQIITTAAPNDVELSHHYLWRFWNSIPKTGHLAIYDRSWYGRVMVERVEGFATNGEVKRAYEEINEFEASLTNFGAIVIKFFLHISMEEQLKRFENRQNNESKVWKITEEDWRNREKWHLYTEAVNDMIKKTDTEDAPWIIINGDDKRYARIQAMETIKQICMRKLYVK